MCGFCEKAEEGVASLHPISSLEDILVLFETLFCSFDIAREREIGLMGS